jgi:hypothetical protein
MGLEKAIEHGKEQRRPYYDSRSVDRSCRAHRGCSWCEENRRRQWLRQEVAAAQEARSVAELIDLVG